MYLKIQHKKFDMLYTLSYDWGKIPVLAHLAQGPGELLPSLGVRRRRPS
jgi:hypothetical protein